MRRVLFRAEKRSTKRSGKQQTSPPAFLSCRRSLRFEGLEERRLLSVIQWSGGPSGTGTNFEDPTNWVGGAVPGPHDDAVIGAAFASETITSAFSATIHSLVCEASFQITAGTLTVGSTVEVDNTFTLSGGTLAGATVQLGSGGQELICTPLGGALDGVTLRGNLDLSSENNANVQMWTV